MNRATRRRAAKHGKPVVLRFLEDRGARVPRHWYDRRYPATYSARGIAITVPAFR